MNDMIIIIQIISAFFIGLLLVAYSIPIIVRISKEKHLFDVPNHRKVNKQVVPNLGGIALFVGISLASLLSIMKEPFPDLRFILASMIILFFIGVKDDILVISPRKKFIAQIISALILIVLGEIRLTHLHGILGLYEINYVFSLLISLLAIVAIINALNLIDGIDGLAAAIGILACSFLGANFILLGNILYAILSFATIGSLSSFAFYNVFGRQNKIFMGDTGSLLIGLLLSVFAIKYNEIAITSGEEISNFSPVFSLAILAVPIFDMIRLFIIRIIQKKSPFSPDINHIHHKLLKIGFSHRMSTFFILAANLLIIGIVYVSRSLNNNLSLLILISLVTSFSFFPRFVYEYKKAQNRRSYYKSTNEKKIPIFGYDGGNRIIELSNRTKNEKEIEVRKPKIGVGMN
jgi:UDP-N-acetylmuramyl pentapeptide phosphotransferase/UDP-N-acetylglucosamine-1-phosphate transferase